jgi:uncharacterized protein (DUF362 family)
VKITIGESDGGYNGYRAEEAFQGHGLYALAKRYGVNVVNLSRLPSEVVSGSLDGHAVDVRLPSMLLKGVDVFVSIAVPKIHAMTGVSLGFKNQWGCIPDAMRIRFHPDFARKVLFIHKCLNPRLMLFDGQWFLDRTGPLVGDPIKMDLVIASDDVGAASLACCEIMGISPCSVQHLALARRLGLLPGSLSEIEFSRAVEEFKTHRFELRRSLVNVIALFAFHNRALNSLLYDSKVADWAHACLYRLRRSEGVARLLYGRVGPPEVEGTRHQRTG